MNKNDILINLSESENTRFGNEDFALQTLPQKVFSAIWAVESEVNNGGFLPILFQRQRGISIIRCASSRNSWCSENREYLQSRDSHGFSWWTANDGGNYTLGRR